MNIGDKKFFDFGKRANLFEGNALWIGKFPPIIANQLDLIDFVNCRAPANMHGKHDVVWIYERELFSQGSVWRLVLDEAIRLLKRVGTLLIRVNDCEYGTLFELKSMLGRNPNLAVKLVAQEIIDDAGVVVVFRIERLFFEEYNRSEWTIGILSDGRKETGVRNLIDSIEKDANGRVVEILIAGPVFDIRGMSSNIYFIQNEITDRLPRISEKKLNILSCAKYPNVAIFHDRYIVEDGFFSGFDVYGYDFDFLTVEQRYENGAYFPGYIGFHKRELKWSRPVFSRDYNLLQDGHYINGGFTVVKAHTGKLIKFNCLLLHNEAEDVELAFSLRSAGIIPRINCNSSIMTVGVPVTYTETFVDLTFHLRKKENRSREGVARMLFSLWKKIPIRYKSHIKKSLIYDRIHRFLFPR